MDWNLEIICLDIQRCPTIPAHHPTRTIRALSRSQKHVDIAHIKQMYNSNEMPVPHPQPRACFAFHGVRKGYVVRKVPLSVCAGSVMHACVQKQQCL
jgi:hypothetical protein